MTVTFKPRLAEMPLAAGLAASGSGELWQEKSDGIWEPGGLAWQGHRFNAERMPGGVWVVNDLTHAAGLDVRGWPTWARWDALRDLARGFPSGLRLCRAGSGGEFLRAILAAGGEGVVLKPLDAPFAAGWVKCKRRVTFDLRVAAKHEDSGTLEVATFDGEPRGRCPARALFDWIAPGDAVEVACLGLTPSGKLREPRLVRLRRDLSKSSLPTSI